MRTVLSLCLVALAGVALGQWEPEVRMTNTANSEYTSPSNAWCVATGPGAIVHIAYWYAPVNNGNFEIYYRRSTDAGATWGDTVRLTSATLTSQQPCLAVQDSFIYVVYMDYRNGTDYEIYFQRSTDAGATWGSETRLTSDPGISNNPCIAVSGANLHVAYDDQRGGTCKVYYRRSTDRGLTWSSEVALTSNTFYPAFPCLAAIGSYVHFAWNDWRVPKGSVYYRRSTDSGSTWELEVPLVLVDSYTYGPSLAVSGARVYMTWNDYRFNDPEIFFKRSDDNGAHWGADVRITDAWGISQDPNIAVSGTDAYIVFDENQGQWDIMFTRSTNNGSTWTTPEFLCSSPNRSFYPSIATDGTALHVVWHDMRDGNREIYYRRNPHAVGMEEERDTPYAVRRTHEATIVRGVLRLAKTGTVPLWGLSPLSLVDADGRRVMELRLGPNDVSGLAPGVYFISGPSAGGRQPSARVVVIQR